MKALVAYATPAVQAVVEVSLADGATVADAIAASGLLGQFPDIDLACQPVGSFGSPRKLDDPVREGDRLEIYRSLAEDPKLARMRRVQEGT